MDYDGPFGWNQLTLEHFCQNVVPFLQQLESMSWAEIEGSKHHFLSWEGLSKKATKRFNAIVECLPVEPDDVERLFSIRLGGPTRIIGIRNRDVFHVLWWDPNHQVFPSPKKHT